MAVEYDPRGRGSKWRDPKTGRWAKREQWWEVAIYTDYKEDDKNRHDRYELRTVVQAQTEEEAQDSAMAKFMDKIPDDYRDFLDALGIFGLETDVGIRKLDAQDYTGVRYFRFPHDGHRPRDPKAEWE